MGSKIDIYALKERPEFKVGLGDWACGWLPSAAGCCPIDDGLQRAQPVRGSARPDMHAHLDSSLLT